MRVIGICFVASMAFTGRALAQEGFQLVELREFMLELNAVWERLTDTVYKFEEQYPLIRDLAPAMERASYDSASFLPFLPEHPVGLGEVWKIDAEAALPFLRQFHPGATAGLHHDNGTGLGAPGGWACLRALSPKYAEVFLRVHAEFVLEGSGAMHDSSWFTPAQFRGRMVLDRERRQVVAFELAVPAQSANVDVNVRDGEHIVADIGRIPRMELRGGEFPASSQVKEISVEEASQLLARRFYPFAELEWLDLRAALAKSRETGKPMHILALFGSLLDESC